MTLEQGPNPRLVECPFCGTDLAENPNRRTVHLSRCEKADDAREIRY